MRSLRALLIRLGGLFRTRGRDEDFSAELASNLQSHIDDNVRGGMTPGEARRQALMTMGGVDVTREQHRDRRGIHGIDALRQDGQYAWRTFRRSPGFVAVVVLTLALGIGVNTLVFSFVNAVLFRPLPIADAERVVFVQPASASFVSQSYPNYRDLRDRNTVFDGLIGYRMAPMDLEANGAPARAWGYLATGNYFDVLGVQPAIGRFFHPADDQQPGAAPFAVLSHDFWQSRFLGDSSVIGTTIRVNRKPYTVLGVAPAGFVGTELYYRPQLWVPMMMQAQVEAGNPWLERRSTFNVWVAGRLKPHVTRAQALADVNSIATTLARDYPNENAGLAFKLTKPGFAGDTGRGPVEAFGTGLLVLAALVLLIACTNLASTLAARGADRSREISIRLAIGASRVRVIRQLVTETLLLSIAAGIAGFAIAHVGAAAFSALRAPVELPAQIDIHPDLRVLLFTFAASCAAGLFFGLAPARQATRIDVNAALKNTAGATRRRWALRDVLVAVQVALCFVLVSACLLSLRGLQQAVTMPLGFDPQHLSTMGFELGLAGYDVPRGTAFQRRALEAVSALPGVERAAYSDTLPLNLNQSNTAVFPDLPVGERGGHGRPAFTYLVSPEFFSTVGIPLHRGRVFDTRDTRTTPPVAVVNETFARAVFGTADAVGRRFNFGPASSATIEVIGIVGDGKYSSLTETPQLAMFSSTLQRYNATTTLLVKSSVPSDVMVAQMRRAIAKLDASLPIYGAGSTEQLLALPLFPNRAAAAALSAFGLLAIVLAATGIHGAVAYAVARRRREVGIRVAIGATRSDVLRLLFGRTAWLVGSGALAGGALALMLGPVLTQVVYLAAPRQPSALALVTAIVCLAGFAACWSPAWRSLRIDPAVALRED